MSRDSKTTKNRLENDQESTRNQLLGRGVGGGGGDESGGWAVAEKHCHYSMDRYQCGPELQRDLGAIGPYEFQGSFWLPGVARVLSWRLGSNFIKNHPPNSLHKTFRNNLYKQSLLVPLKQGENKQKEFAQTALRCFELQFAVLNDSNRHRFAAIPNRTLRITRPKNRSNRCSGFTIFHC